MYFFGGVGWGGWGQGEVKVCEFWGFFSFPVTVVKPWYRMAREVQEFPVLRHIQNLAS